MGIFNWVQSKLNGRPRDSSRKKPDSISDKEDCAQKEPCKEESMEWPHGLLAIGTIGNVSNLKDQYPDHDHEPEDSASVISGDDSCWRTTSAAFSKSPNKSVITKASFSFILKQMVACSSGFPSPPPSFKDPIPESRLEKIMKGILLKKMKIYPQSCSTSTTPASAKKKYLKNKSADHKLIKSADEDDANDESGSKWVKTDSEYIVLEI